MSQHWFLLVKCQALCWNWRDPEHILHVSWSIFDSVSPLSPRKVYFISQIIKIAYKIRNCVYIWSILSFHYFVSFWEIWLYHIWSSIRGLFVTSIFIFITYVAHSIVPLVSLLVLGEETQASASIWQGNVYKARQDFKEINIIWNYFWSNISLFLLLIEWYHHVIMSSCHHVIMSSCHHVIMS